MLQPTHLAAQLTETSPRRRHAVLCAGHSGDASETVVSAGFELVGAGLAQWPGPRFG
ncbi:Uncharacterised protein [Mycobacteroides abscessus subsp. abscessus]|nr:Uncharacterised protein [Mycobacteroides abscessus subsp. abscessus]